MHIFFSPWRQGRYITSPETHKVIFAKTNLYLLCSRARSIEREKDSVPRIKKDGVFDALHLISTHQLLKDMDQISRRFKRNSSHYMSFAHSAEIFWMCIRLLSANTYCLNQHLRKNLTVFTLNMERFAEIWLKAWAFWSKSLAIPLIPETHPGKLI
jgi:hypothetical protein